MNALRTLSIAAALLATATLATARDGADLDRIPVERLKSTYLECARMSEQRPLSPDETLACQRVAQALQARAFDGSFERLIAWWQAERRRSEASAAR